MAYDYIGISNKVLQAFNEVTFADATEFTAATGFQKYIKEAVNEILSEIHSREDNEWPFQLTATTQVVTVGTTDYSTPADRSNVDWDSFFIDKVFADETDFTSVTADSGTKTFTIAGGSFITEGFAVGMKVRWTDLSANTDADVTINTLTATVMTVDETVTTITTPDTEFTVTNAFNAPDARKLALMNRDTYRNNYLENARNVREPESFGKPDAIVRNTDNTFTTSPLKPDQTYLIRYEYFDSFTELSAATDVPTIPQRYEKIILDGTKKKGNEFRDNVELAAFFENMFDDGINQMRRNLIPQSDTMRYEP